MKEFFAFWFRNVGSAFSSARSRVELLGFILSTCVAFPPIANLLPPEASAVLQQSALQLAMVFLSLLIFELLFVASFRQYAATKKQLDDAQQKLAERPWTKIQLQKEIARLSAAGESLALRSRVEAIDTVAPLIDAWIAEVQAFTDARVENINFRRVLIGRDPARIADLEPAPPGEEGPIGITRSEPRTPDELVGVYHYRLRLLADSLSKPQISVTESEARFG